MYSAFVSFIVNNFFLENFGRVWKVFGSVRKVFGNDLKIFVSVRQCFTSVFKSSFFPDELLYRVVLIWSCVHLKILLLSL